MSELALQLIRQAKAEGWTTLDLGYTGLTELPEELFELEQLETLIISNEYYDYEKKEWIDSKHPGDRNYLQGKLPAGFAQLKRLKQLYIDGGFTKWGLQDVAILEKLTNLTSLDLSDNQISDIRVLEKLTNLTSLHLRDNQISDIRVLEKLTNLTSLHLSDNQISDLNPLAGLTDLSWLYLYKNQISDISPLENLTQLTSLNLHTNQINNISPLKNLTQLTLLNLSSNEISDIHFLENLTQLDYLNLHTNQISDIRPLKNLTQLTSLYLNGNQINNIHALENLIQLTSLYLGNNQIKNISPLRPLIEQGVPVKLEMYISDAINLIHNHLEIPPVEVVKEGNAAIWNYFKELEGGEEIVYEARLLILGEAGSGKTTLSRKIENAHAEMPDEVMDTTTGINIRTQVLAGGVKQKDFTMHVWDFGGQEIYHATHQFFLSKRSLYVLLADGRREESLDYWLQVQELFGKDSPLLIVFNQKGTIHQDVPIAEIRGLYQNVKDFRKVNLKEDTSSVQKLRQQIEYHIRFLPHLERGEKVPKKWAKVRAKLSDIPDNHIAVTQFRAICVAEGLDTRERQDFLSDYLHDLGVLLHFKDVPYLNKLVILKPEWATDAVYRVLDHTKQQNKAGHFTRQALQQVWDCEDYLEYADELLQLMERFELCYPVSEDKNLYIVPQLLPGDKPKYDWDNRHNLQLVYSYDFLPKGIVTRLIVRLHKSLENQQNVWKRGAIFQYDQTRAEVIENQRDKRITIKAKGLNTRGLVSIIAKEMDEINSTFHFNERMKVRKLVPCNCATCDNRNALGEQPHFYDYKKLTARLENNKFTVECDYSYQDVNIQQLIQEVFVTVLRRPGAKKFKAFISYSKQDIAFKERLKKQLSPYEWREQIELWDDRDIDAGQEWEKEIIEHLENDDFIFLLISPDFIATRYIWDVEVPKALERHRKGEATVIPIILRPCNWEKLDFSHIQALPDKGVPITKWSDPDEAWLAVEKGIEKVLAQF